MLSRRVLSLILTLIPAVLASQNSPVSHTQVVILGSGNPAATPDTWGPAVAIVVDGAVYLVDCGPGVVRRAAAAEQKGIAALKATNLKYVFITHLHSDHTLGYPDLIFSPWVLGREEPLQAYGPKGLASMTEHLEKAWEKDVAIRTNGLEHGNLTGYKVQVHEVDPGVVFKDAKITVRAFPVRHGSWDQAYGYRFDTADRSIVISGDTSPADEVVKACHGCDVLLHEAYQQARYAAQSPDRQKYMRSFHTSTAEVGKLATEAKPHLLVLYHYSGSDHEGRVREVKQYFSGNVVSAHDLDVY